MPRIIESDGMTHAGLVQVAAHWLRHSRDCGVVLTERGISEEIPDAIGWGKVCIVVECKLSRADFLCDLRKPCRQSGVVAFGRERWYLTPPGLFVAGTELPDGWGLIEWTGRVVRRREASKLWPHSNERLAMENRLLLSELRIYQAQGIGYLTISEQNDAARQRRLDREAELWAIGVYPLEAQG